MAGLSRNYIVDRLIDTLLTDHRDRLSRFTAFPVCAALNMEACYVTLKVEPCSPSSGKGKIVLEMRTIETQRLVCSSDPIDMVVEVGGNNLRLLAVAGDRFVVVQTDANVLHWTLVSIVYCAVGSAATLVPTIQQVIQHEKLKPARSECRVIDGHRLLAMEYDRNNCVTCLYNINDGRELSCVTTNNDARGIEQNALMMEHSMIFSAINRVDKMIKFAGIHNPPKLESSSICSYFKEAGLIVILGLHRFTVWRKDGPKLTQVLDHQDDRFTVIISFEAIVGDYCLMRYYSQGLTWVIRNIRTGVDTHVGKYSCLVVPTMEQLQAVYRPHLLEKFKGCKDLADLVIGYLGDVYSVKARIPL